jgi:hypothetical protein
MNFSKARVPEGLLICGISTSRQHNLKPSKKFINSLPKILFQTIKIRADTNIKITVSRQK